MKFKSYEHRVTEWREFSIGLLSPEYNIVGEFSSCRTYLDDEIWKVKFYKKDKIPYENKFYSALVHIKLKGIKNKEECYNIIKNNLIKLNSLEKKYGIGETSITFHPTENFMFVKGDPIWLSEVWKSSLYTNYLKTLLYYDVYTGIRDDNEDLLWSLVPLHNKEVLSTNETMNHCNSGFVTFCNKGGLNQHMRETYKEILKERELANVDY